MNTRIVFLLLLIVLPGCSSLDLPPTKDSREAITRHQHRVDSLHTIINASSLPRLGDREVEVKLNRDFLNRILSKLANQRPDDIRVRFLRTAPLLKEDKSLLGIGYTNVLNVDSGYVAVNIKSLKILGFGSSTLDVELELEGTGTIQVSGRYTGIPATAQPAVHLYLKEKVRFSLTATSQGMVVMTPQPKTLLLKSKISLKLLEWSVPWYQEVPLNLTDLVKPISVPASLAATVQFPLPDDSGPANSMRLTPFELRLTRARVRTMEEWIEYSSDADLVRK